MTQNRRGRRRERSGGERENKSTSIETLAIKIKAFQRRTNRIQFTRKNLWPPFCLYEWSLKLNQKTQFLGKKQELNFSLGLKWLREDKCVTCRREAKTQGLQWHQLNKRSPASGICEPEYQVGSSNLNQNARDQGRGGGFGYIFICIHMGTLPVARENNTDRLTRRMTLARAVRSSNDDRPHHVRQSLYDPVQHPPSILYLIDR